MSGLTITDGVGVLGAALIVIAYFLLQLGRLESRSLSYSVANALGASAILFSLVYEFNFGAFVIESFWLVISLYGVFSAVRSRRLL